jgi:hypothetical protein
MNNKSKFQSQKDNLIEVVITCYEWDVNEDMNKVKELENIVEKFLATIQRTFRKEGE